MRPPDHAYLVCATPRSGSTLLSELLRATGVAGRPLEHFEVLRASGAPRQPREYFDGVHDFGVLDRLASLRPPAPGRDGETPETWWRRILADGTTPNGVWAGKLMLGPVPNRVFTIYRNWWGLPPDLTDANPANEFTKQAWDYLLYAGLVEATKWGFEDERVSLWMEKADKIARNMEIEDARSRTTARQPVSDYPG